MTIISNPGTSIAAVQALLTGKVDTRALNRTDPLFMGRVKGFFSALYNVSTRPVIVRTIGTSIAQDPGPAYYLAAALQRVCGKAGAVWQPAASSASNPINGWLAQYYAGLYSNRLRGQAGGGVTPITRTVRASSYTVAYSTEPDGGTITVTINGVTQTAINCLAAATTYGNLQTYTLDPTVLSTIVLTPPASGYGYLEGYIVGAPSPFSDRGLRFDNAAYGGSSLGEMGGTQVRTADGGMAASATPAGGDLGLLASFAAVGGPGVAMTAGGTGYSDQFPVLFPGGGFTAAGITALGSGATAGQVVSGAITAPGAGYTVAPYVALVGGGGIGAKAWAVLGTGGTAGQVIALTIAAGGTGYTSAPTPVFSTAYGTAVINAGAVAGVVINDPGYGYTGTPTPSFAAGAGTGAAATVTLAGGAVQGAASALQKPDLLLYSGPTNDASVATPSDFLANLTKGVGYAVANRTPVILVLEPANGLSYPSQVGQGGIGGGVTSGTNVWDSYREMFYAVAALFPDDVILFDYDYFLHVGAYAQRYHSQSLGDPHPQETGRVDFPRLNGYGDPRPMAGSALSVALGFPPAATPPLTPDAQAQFAASSVLAQATEPLYAPPGTVWQDTSFVVAGELKRKITTFSPGPRGIWEVVQSAAHPNLINAVGVGNPRVGAWALDTYFPGEPRTLVTAQLQITVDPTKLVAGQVYTLSFTHEATLALGSSNVYFFIGSTIYYLDQASGTFLVGTTPLDQITSSPRAATRVSYTFTWASSGTQTAAGMTISNVYLRFDPMAGTVPGVYISQLRLEQGASATAGIGRVPPPLVENLWSSAYTIRAHTRATEPLSTEAGMARGVSRWSDTSNSPAVLKRLLMAGGVVPIGAAGVAPGDNVWEVPAGPQANMMAGATSSIAFGAVTIATVTDGPGLIVPGFQYTFPNVGSTAAFIIASIANMNLAPGTWYTLSFLWKWDYVAGVVSGAPVPAFGVQVSASGAISNVLNVDQLTWTTQATATLPFNPAVPARGVWQRSSLKYQPYTALQQANASNVKQQFEMRVGLAGFIVTLVDIRLEIGSSVTTD